MHIKLNMYHGRSRERQVKSVTLWIVAAASATFKANCYRLDMHCKKEKVDQIQFYFVFMYFECLSHSIAAAHLW